MLKMYIFNIVTLYLNKKKGKIMKSTYEKVISSTLIKSVFNLALFYGAFLITPELMAQHSLERLWATDTVLTRPESVLYDASSKSLFVSNIGDMQKEGTGSISKIGPDGKIIKRYWIKGLTAPKGLGIYKNKLYAAETKSVAVIDLSTATIVQRIPVEGAEMLNDISIDEKGTVYVSDTRRNRVHKIENGKPTVYLENMNSANGLLAKGNNLYILTGTTLQIADENKKLSTLADGIEGGADGIEMIGAHEFIVTGWGGVIYYVNDDGSKQVLSDTRDRKINAADLGYDPVSGTIYIPEMTQNCVVAYKLK
jgi:sugar lactone lactonase YvrE